MSWSCADICDSEGDSVQYADCMPFIQYSKVKKFSGRIRTVKCFEDNSKVKEVLASPGERDVLVVDAGASLRRAILGDLIANSAANNDWAGVLINGAVRDSGVIGEMDSIGIAALGTNPRKSDRRGHGLVDEPVCFCGLSFVAGDFVYVDHDGVIVSKTRLHV